MKVLFLVSALLVLIVACDDGTTVRKPGPDNAVTDQDGLVVTDTDELLSDDLLNDEQPTSDDGQPVNDDGQLVNDDGQVITDDGEPISDDGTIITDDEEPINDDGTVITDDGAVWPDDGTVVTDDGTIITDDGVVWPDDDTVVNSCGTNADCAPTEYCAKPDGTCMAYLAGTCETRPQICPPLYAPVCGCDGVTYGSKCDAAVAGVNVDYEGECSTEPGCYEDADCDPNGTISQFCLFEVGACAGPGTCSDYPIDCPLIIDFVCGCDGNTYDNACLAAKQGVSVMYEGECQEQKFSTLYYYYDQASMSEPDAHITVVTDNGDVEFPTADLVTRTTFGTYPNNGVYLRTTFYGMTDDGSKIEFQLTVYQSGFSVPKTFTLDGVENYARWSRAGNVVVGNLTGQVTLQQYQRNYQGVITLIEITGDQLTFVPN